MLLLRKRKVMQVLLLRRSEKERGKSRIGVGEVKIQIGDAVGSEVEKE